MSGLRTMCCSVRNLARFLVCIEKNQTRTVVSKNESSEIHQLVHKYTFILMERTYTQSVEKQKDSSGTFLKNTERLLKNTETLEMHRDSKMQNR